MCVITVSQRWEGNLNVEPYSKGHSRVFSSTPKGTGETTLKRLPVVGSVLGTTRVLVTS